MPRGVYDRSKSNWKPWAKGKTKETDPRLNYYRPTAFKKGIKSWHGCKHFCVDCGKEVLTNVKRCRLCRDKFYVGEKRPNWKGGRHLNTDGYVIVLSKNHPYLNHPDGYVLEHRLAIEKHLGRYLKRTEEVHHINGIRDDNRISNLMLFVNRSVHKKFEQGENFTQEEIIFDGRRRL